MSDPTQAATQLYTDAANIILSIGGPGFVVWYIKTQFGKIDKRFVENEKKHDVCKLDMIARTDTNGKTIAEHVAYHKGKEAGA